MNYMTQQQYILYYAPTDKNSQNFLRQLEELQTLSQNVQKIDIYTLRQCPVQYVPTIYDRKERKQYPGSKAFEFLKQHDEVAFFDPRGMGDGGALGFTHLEGGFIGSQEGFVKMSEFDKNCSGKTD